jgi:hypothetical protein
MVSRVSQCPNPPLARVKFTRAEVTNLGYRPTTDQPAFWLVLSFSYSQAVPQRSHL